MAKTATRVWVTRTLPEAHNTAKAVASLGFEPLIAPVLEVVRLAADWPQSFPNSGPDAVILTSAHALEALQADGPFEQLTHLPLFAVGERLKTKAVTAGFNGPVFAAPTAEALLEVIATHMPPAARLLYLAPKDPAALLDGWLTDKGFQVTKLIVYETRPIAPDPTILSDEPLIVLLHSPKAAYTVGQWLRDNTNVMPAPASRRFRLDVLTFICISEAAHQGLMSGLDSTHLMGVCCYVADTPDEAGMMARLKACRAG